MPDYRFATVGPSEVAANTQFKSFLEDPFGDGSVVWGTRAIPEGGSVEEWIYEPGVTGHFFIDDNGGYRWDIRLYGPRAQDAIFPQFKVNGVSGQRLTERRRLLFDDSDPPVQIGDEVYASGNLEVRQWRNVLLILGEGNEEAIDPDTGLPIEGQPSSWPPELEEHRWL